jgi:hypothetical protein
LNSALLAAVTLCSKVISLLSFILLWNLERFLRPLQFLAGSLRTQRCYLSYASGLRISPHSHSLSCAWPSELLDLKQSPPAMTPWAWQASRWLSVNP